MSKAGQGKRRLSVPITVFLVLTFGGLTTIALLGQVAIGWFFARENTEELIRDKAQVTVDGIESRVHSTLDPVVAQGWTMANMAQIGPILEDPRVDPFVIGSLAATPQVQSIALLVPGKTGREYRRKAAGFDVLEREFDAEARDIIERARLLGQSFWAEPKLQEGVVVLIHHTLVLDSHGALRGVLVQTVNGAALSREVARVAVGNEQQTPFILYGEAAVLAHPLLISSRANFPALGGRVPSAAEIGDQVLSNIWNANELKLLRPALSSGDVVKGLSVGGNVYLFAFRAIAGYSEQPWIVGTYIDGSRTRTQMRRLVFIGLAGFVILLLVAAMAIVIGRGASRPAGRLARAAQLVSDGELDQVVALPTTLLRELDEASVSFNAMVEGLRERKVIRDLFGKFVPERVAAAMLHSPEGLAPQSCEATILFVDVEGFTALAEAIGPVAIVDLLNAYFGELVAIIETYDGIVTQFQGDAILAVFNVPRAVQGHARHAVETAHAIQLRVAEKTFAGRRLSCRIGIATGRIVAGNVGAEGRMNYTVHGDAVNLAARLEQLNKDYGTHILIAESTVRQIDDIEFRRLGTVDVRGRTAQITLYTLPDPAVLSAPSGLPDSRKPSASPVSKADWD